MSNTEHAKPKLPMTRSPGRVSAATLARWALVRQIAELEEMLADTYHPADDEADHLGLDSTRRALAHKRAVLRAM